MKINDILIKENLGVLSDDDVLHASGITDKGNRVWLPQTNVNDYWDNIVLASDEVIVQTGKTKNDSQRQPPTWESTIVITRDKPNGVYKRLPDKYRPVFFDKNDCRTIYAKENSPTAQGISSNNGTIYWIEGFAATAEEAREKADSLRKKAT